MLAYVDRMQMSGRRLLRLTERGAAQSDHARLCFFLPLLHQMLRCSTLVQLYHVRRLWLPAPAKQSGHGSESLLDRCMQWLKERSD